MQIFDVNKQGVLAAKAHATRMPRQEVIISPGVNVSDIAIIHLAVMYFFQLK
jgi:hypothetical protein